MELILSSLCLVGAAIGSIIFWIVACAYFAGYVEMLKGKDE